MAPKTQKQKERTFLAWDKEYFNGSTSSIYFGDIWIDEVSMFQVEVVHTKTPVYGYASNFFDAIIDGPVLVRGSFAINYKETGYLYMALEAYQSRIKGKANSYGPYDGNEKKNQIKRANLESMINNSNIYGPVSKQPPDGWEYEQYKQITNFASYAQANDRGLDKFENLAEEFEDVFWKQSKRFGGPNSINESSRNSLGIERDGFDIYVINGDYNNPIANHTTRKIHNVNLVSSSMVIDSSGRPIQEVYGFLAKNLI
jgi:hypothetical protein